MNRNIRQIILTLLLIALSTSCASGGILYGKMSGITTKKINQFCKNEGDIEFTDWGYLYVDPDQKPHLDFTVYRELDQNEARKLCIYLLESLRDIFNNTEDMRNYLDTYPCSITDFCIQILFSDPAKRFTVPEICDVTPGMVTTVVAKNGHVAYAAYDPELKGERWFDKELCMKAQSIAKFKSD